MDIAADIQADQPLLGGLIQEFSGTAYVDTRLRIDFSQVASNPALEDKLRLDNLDELFNLRVAFNGNPLHSFQAIVQARLQVPGLKDSQGNDAQVDLIGGVVIPPGEERALFELRTGAFRNPSSSERENRRSERENLATYTLTEGVIDDEYEENDTREQVDNQLVLQPGRPISSNFGVLSDLLVTGDFSSAFKSLGPIRLGIERFELADFDISGSIVLGGVVNGVFQPTFGGQITVAARTGDFHASLTIHDTSTLTTVAGRGGKRLPD